MDTIKTWAKHLNGHIILFKENHDLGASAYSELGIELIEGILVNKKRIPALENINVVITEIKGLRIMFSNFPVKNDIEEDERFRPITDKLFEIFRGYNCDINVHGHIHSYILGNAPFCRNVSVKTTGFKPVRIREML